MILLGRQIADEIIEKLRQRSVPDKKLVVIQVGNDKSSRLYVSKKKDLAKKLQVEFEVLAYDTVVKQDLIKKIDELNRDETVGGILVQLPLPEDLDRDEILSSIAPQKDVDGFRYILGEDDYETFPPTILAIDELLNFYKIEKKNKKILVVGGGFLVGRPLFKYWQNQGLQVEILKRDNLNYDRELSSADLVILATGGGRKFSQSDFKDGAIIIDASTVASDAKIGGDIENINWPENKSLAPVPGGVGPITVAMLFKNFYKIAG